MSDDLTDCLRQLVVETNDDDMGRQTIVIDEMDIMETGEFRQLIMPNDLLDDEFG
ncbi:MAG: hypothetical protein WD672_04330 [Woeseia sp.]